MEKVFALLLSKNIEIPEGMHTFIQVYPIIFLFSDGSTSILNNCPLTYPNIRATETLICLFRYLDYCSSSEIYSVMVSKIHTRILDVYTINGS